METFQCFLRSGRLKDIIVRLLLKENVLLIFFYVVDCVAASGNTPMFSKEHVTASERYQYERKYAAAS